MSAPVERAARLVEIIQLFQAGHRLNVADLAQRYEVSRRTIRRDLLCLMGEPFFLPLVCCDLEEWRLASDE